MNTSRTLDPNDPAALGALKARSPKSQLAQSPRSVDIITVSLWHSGPLWRRLWAQGVGFMASSLKFQVTGFRFVVEGLSLRVEEGDSDEKKSTNHIGKVSLPCRSASSRSTLKP